jgi:lathosterol oxidase
MFQEEADWYNGVVLGAVVPDNWWRRLPHPLRSWLRNTVGVYLIYFISGFLWCFVIYYWKRTAYIPKGSISPIQQHVCFSRKELMGVGITRS